MNNLKRLYISIKSQIDQVADEFENHEALAGVAISDLQAMATKTRLHCHRVSKMTEGYQSQLEQQKKQAQLWSERAVKARETDEQKALQCVKRLRQTNRQITLLEEQCLESSTQESKIREDLEAIQEKLQILKNKKEILAARQNRAGVNEVLQVNNGNSLDDVNNIFDRWEGSVVSSEIEVPEKIDADQLANSFEKEEDDLVLMEMLNELTEKNSDSDNNETGSSHVRK